MTSREEEALPTGAPSILLIQGLNIRQLGFRLPDVYGTTTAAELERSLLDRASLLKCHLAIRYADTPFEAVDQIRAALHRDLDGLLMNPAGFSESCEELSQFLISLPVPYVEVHLTNLERRGIRSAASKHATGVIMGLGIPSYFLALSAIVALASENAARRSPAT